MNDLRDALTGAPELLFLCSGNMIRSAFAELWARHRGVGVPVRSAATTYRNDSLLPETARALIARGVDPRATRGFRPTHLADLAPPLAAGGVVFGMTEEHLAAARLMLPEGTPLFLLEQLRGRGREIHDPMFEGRFEEAFAAIEQCIEVLAAIW